MPGRAEEASMGERGVGDRGVGQGGTSGAAHGKRPHTRRWAEQRWLVDNVIQANGIDWDQPRSVYLNAPCGPEANADFAGLRAQVKKFADAASAFEAAAKRRQAKAEAAEAEGRLVTARENYFIAAILWGGAQWPIDEADATNHRYNTAKRDCYRAYARLADHRVEEVFVPFGGKVLPAWFHLPPGYTGGKLPTVISIPGMDSFKEGVVSMYGDRFLARGMAVLALDGPGQYEAPLMNVFFSMENWIATGPAAVDWLVARPEVDAERIALAGRSFAPSSARSPPPTSRASAPAPSAPPATSPAARRSSKRPRRPSSSASCSCAA